LDWEYPQNAATSRRWAGLISSLRAGLDGLSRKTDKKYMLTAAVGPVKWYAMWIPADTVNEKLDFLHIMTYNYCGIWGGRAGEHAPIYSSLGRGDIASSLRYWTDVKHIPKSKLVVGLPFYSYIFNGYEPGEAVNPKGTPSKNVVPVAYADINSKLSAGRWEKSLDSATRVQWYRSADGRSFMAIDGPEAIRYKTLWVLKSGYRGVFCWAMRQDVAPNGD
ncbi:MAG TPA: glycoside hydrolase family 18 protein, partial [Phycisphaerae bacterium]|nr:glycoside hydrolase family 18 protein [Phycisphaerae bacterium]